MRTSVYLTNRAIVAAAGDTRGGGLRVKGLWRREIPWGLVHNGIVTDGKALAQQLAAFWQEHALPTKGVSLVIDSDAVTGRVMEVPPLEPKAMRRLVANALTEAGPGDGLLCDYTALTPAPRPGQEEAVQRIYAVAAERQHIEAFAKLAQSIGVRLSGIDLAPMCARRFFREAEGYRSQTFIYTLLVGPDIVSILFNDGEYAFLDRGQLMEARGTPAAAVEISRSINSMSQYNYASGTGTPLSHVYISGLMGEELQFYGDIADALSLNVGPVSPGLCTPEPGLKAPDDWGEYLFCLGDLLC